MRILVFSVFLCVVVVNHNFIDDRAIDNFPSKLDYDVAVVVLFVLM